MRTQQAFVNGTVAAAPPPPPLHILLKLPLPKPKVKKQLVKRKSETAQNSSSSKIDLKRVC